MISINKLTTDSIYHWQELAGILSKGQQPLLNDFKSFLSIK